MSIKIKKTIRGEAVTATTNTQVENPYTEAIDAIQSAISALGAVAKTGDSLARESIANLSVVLLDLK